VAPLPVGVGDLDAQRAFLQEHASFLKHYPVLKKVVERALCRPLASPSQADIDRLQERNHDDAEVVAFENAATTDRVVFFLGRIAADDFGEIIILSGNGRGIGAYKILRGMYERVVHAVYLNKNEEATRTFVRRSDVDKLKLATRLQGFGIDVLSDFTEEDKAELAIRAAEAKNDKPMLDLSAMAERAGQGLDKMYGPCYLEPTIHTHANSFGIERRLVKTPEGYSYNEAEYRHQSRRALLFGHNLLIHNLDLQNKRFTLGFDRELQDCVKAFTEIWGQRSSTGASDSSVS